MALAASSHASTSALSTAALEIVPPASPFAQLLRSSRFATFDPQIRKTYYSPKQFVERGYWGLKRPITQRKRNSFITIKQWEARQHYTEWDNAEDEVRFVRRIEELDIRPSSRLNTRWAMSLGPAGKTWLVDSEFAPHQWDQTAEEKKRQEEMEQKREEDGPIDISTLGNRGAGEYGARGFKRLVEKTYSRTPTSVIPNVASMTQQQFARYLAKLRALRPAFAEYLAAEGERRNLLGTEDPANPLFGKTLLAIAQRRDTMHHRMFLAEHTEAEYERSSNIQPQPHRAAALLYSHPTQLDTLFRSPPKPGIVLSNDTSFGRFHDGQKKGYIASFAGIAAVLPSNQAAGKEPLMKGGIDRERWPNAVTELRPTAFWVHGVPRVVGRRTQGLDGVRVELHVSAEPGFDHPSRKNPYPPGSRMYVALQGDIPPPPPPASAVPSGVDVARASFMRTDAAAPAGARVGNAPVRTQPPAPSFAESTMQAIQTDTERAQNKATIDLLQGILAVNKSEKVGDEEM